ncbi:MAG: c-type cytochrome domain-containing protein [bacterium]|jgi:mono/diheme cytochrome c family protein
MRNGIVIYALLLAGLIAGTGVYGAEPKVLEFERDILPIFTANCIGCHGENDPQADLSLGKLEGVLQGSRNGKVILPANADESKLLLLITGKSQPAMPPRPLLPLTEEEIQTLRTWVGQGANADQAASDPVQEKSSDRKITEDTTAEKTSKVAVQVELKQEKPAAKQKPEPETEEKPVAVVAVDAPDFENEIHPIFLMNCVGCHGGAEPAAQLSLVDFDSLMKGSIQGPSIVPGKSVESKLIQVLTGEATPAMPPKPLQPLSKEDIELIQKWIDAGAPEKPVLSQPPLIAQAEAQANTPDNAGKSGTEQKVEPAESTVVKAVEESVEDNAPWRNAEPSGPVGAVAFHPESNLLAVGRLHTVELFAVDAEAGELVPKATLKGHAQVVRALSFSPDGKMLVAAGGRPAVQGELIFWNLDTFEKQAEIKGHTDCIYDVEFAPDGKTFATCSYDRLIKLWSVESFTETSTLKDHVDAVYEIEFSPDGERLASVAADRTLKIWDVEQGKRLFTLSEPQESLFSVAFHPSGKKVIAAGADRMIREWDIDETAGTMTVSKFSHEGGVLRVIYSPDGRTVYSSAEDNQIKSWNTEEYLESRVISDQSDWVNALAISPDGKYLAAGRYDGSLTVYEAESGAPVAVYGASAVEQKQEKQEEIKPATVAQTENTGNFEVKASTESAEKESGTSGEESEAENEGGKVLNDDEGLVRVVMGNGTYPSALSGLNPKAVSQGKTVTMTIQGKNLDNPKIILDSDDISAEIIENEKHPYENLTRVKMNTAAEIVDTGRPHTLKVKLTVGENAAPGVHSIRMQTDLATTNALNFAVEATEAIEEDEDNDSLEQAQPVEFPNILAGSMNRFGDADYYRFEAKAGQEWVFDTMAGALGSGLDALLEIYDEQENLISSSLEYSDKRDAQLGCRFTEDGTYYLKVTDRQLRSGGFYRIHVSNRPFITRVFPLGGQKGEQTPIAVEGFNLQGKITTMLDIPQDHQGRAQSLSYSSTTGSAINGIRLAAGDFPEIMESGEHGSLETAMKVEAPVTINGIIEKNEDDAETDYYRFSVKQGETWVIEVGAQQFGSPLDSLIEIVHADGTPVEIATVRCVAETFLTLSDRDSRSRGIRLDSWADIRINDYMMIGSEIIRVERLPDYPDEDVTFMGNSRTGTRYTYFGTTPSHHAVNAPAYKVEIHEPGRTFPPNGMPVSPLYAMNDDGGAPIHGKDSYFLFTAPQEGDYVVKITDTYGQGSRDHIYRLSIRPQQPDYEIIVDAGSPNIPLGGSIPVRMIASRLDGFEGEIEFRVEGLPEGFSATEGRILPNEETASITITAGENAQTTARDARFKVIATAEIEGKEVIRETSFGMITVTQQPDVIITQEPRELTLNPGGTVAVNVKITRQNGFSGRVPIDVRELPTGVYVMDTGLNGILVTEEEDERTYIIYAEPWVQEMSFPIYSVAIVETRSPLPNRNVSEPSMLHIRKQNTLAQGEE